MGISGTRSFLGGGYAQYQVPSGGLGMPGPMSLLGGGYVLGEWISLPAHLVALNFR